MGSGLAWFTVESADLSDIAAALGVKVSQEGRPMWPCHGNFSEALPGMGA